jgi:hypothetical protein
VAVSQGYFAYDLWDMLRTGMYRFSPPILVHHVVILACVAVAWATAVAERVLILALLCEVNSLCLHVRLLLGMVLKHGAERGRALALAASGRARPAPSPTSSRRRGDVTPTPEPASDDAATASPVGAAAPRAQAPAVPPPPPPLSPRGLALQRVVWACVAVTYVIFRVVPHTGLLLRGLLDATRGLAGWPSPWLWALFTASMSAFAYLNATLARDLVSAWGRESALWPAQLEAWRARDGAGATDEEVRPLRAAEGGGGGGGPADGETGGAGEEEGDASPVVDLRTKMRDL